MVQFQCPDRQNDGQKDGLKEGLILFYRTLPATTGGPKSVNHINRSNISSF